MKHLLIILMALMSLTLQAQDKEGVPFNGTISDIAGKPIKGARIYISEHRVAHSDKQGRFGLTDVQPTDTIHIKYKHELYSIAVEGRKSLRVKLGDQLDAQEDDELVNWGYGFVKKRESLEVSNGISGEDLIKSGYSSLGQALEGRIPGLNIHSNGRPGDETISMRGVNSFYADQTPLFVMDGMVIQSLDMVNLYDIDHIEILKEASIYGSRGANGAILITTKRGVSK